VRNQNEENNFAYIDAANLYNGIKQLGWKLDYARFRIWLQDKYGISQAYLFIGLIPKYSNLYKHLQEAGFILVFKETIYDSNGKPKGNCDADLVVQAMQDIYENDLSKAVIVSSDGDYASLVRVLKEKDKLGVILSPHTSKLCSILLKRTGASIAYLNDQKALLSVR